MARVSGSEYQGMMLKRVLTGRIVVGILPSTRNAALFFETCRAAQCYCSLRLEFGYRLFDIGF